MGRERFFVFKDERSDTFWNIRIGGCSFTVTFGTIGTAGSADTKSFGSEAECQNEAEKLIRSKVKKGYVERETGTPAVDAGEEARLTAWWKDLDAAWRRALQIDDATAGKLKDLQSSRELNLGDSEISTLRPASAFPRLRELNAWGTKISSLDGVEGLADLETLNVSRTAVSDLTPLAGCTRIKELDISQTQIEDLAPLATFTMLKALSALGSRIHSLAPLRKLKKLEHLDISSTRVADLGPLSDLTGLREVQLVGTLVENLEPLHKSDQIHILTCYKTRVSLEQVLKFRAANHEESLGLTLYSDHKTEDPVELAKKIGNPAGLDRQAAEGLALIFKDRLAVRVYQKNFSEAVALLRALLDLWPLPIDFSLQQRLASLAAIVLAAPETPSDLEKTTFAKLIPPDFDNPNLAYNLACMFAKRKMRDELLRYMRLALELGQSPHSFETDEDFSEYRDDEDFKKNLPGG